jgi:hypothetical protein
LSYSLKLLLLDGWIDRPSRRGTTIERALSPGQSGQYVARPTWCSRRLAGTPIELAIQSSYVFTFSRIPARARDARITCLMATWRPVFAPT